MINAVWQCDRNTVQLEICNSNDSPEVSPGDNSWKSRGKTCMWTVWPAKRVFVEDLTVTFTPLLHYLLLLWLSRRDRIGPLEEATPLLIGVKCKTAEYTLVLLWVWMVNISNVTTIQHCHYNFLLHSENTGRQTELQLFSCIITQRNQCQA